MDREEKLHEYAEAWGNLRELPGSPGWETFLDRLRYEYGERQARVTSGRLTSDEYIRECGILEGYSLASQVVDRVKGEYESLLEAAGDAAPWEANGNGHVQGTLSVEG